MSDALGSSSFVGLKLKKLWSWRAGNLYFKSAPHSDVLLHNRHADLSEKVIDRCLEFKIEPDKK